jgi:hypothetical protein
MIKKNDFLNQARLEKYFPFPLGEKSTTVSHATPSSMSAARRGAGKQNGGKEKKGKAGSARGEGVEGVRGGKAGGKGKRMAADAHAGRAFIAP